LITSVGPNDVAAFVASPFLLYNRLHISPSLWLSV